MLAFNSQTINVSEILLLVSDCLMILAAIWTIFSGIEYILGALPIFRQQQTENKVDSVSNP
jgi:CDP-diacylglycerol--glycerol-3-phosphate 3-phosphatidyltransferase